jgi:hypothetical protein
VGGRDSFLKPQLTLEATESRNLLTLCTAITHCVEFVYTVCWHLVYIINVKYGYFVRMLGVIDMLLSLLTLGLTEI